MQLTWILVADRGGARLFSGGLHRLTSVETFARPEGRLKDHELGTAQPGRAFDSVGQGRHAAEPTHEPTENLADEFAQQLAQTLERGRTDHKYDKLVLVADRKFLGRLRGAISKETLRLVSGTLDKDLSNISARDLPTHLAEVLT